MKQLTILGGSAAGVGTDQGCSGYLIQTETTSIVLDLGPDTLLELRKHIDYRELTAIVISHLHMDHILDLFALRFTLSYNPVKAERRIPLLLPPGGLAFMAKAAELFATEPGEIEDYFSEVYDMGEYNPDGLLEIGDFMLTFARTIHPVPCWAIRVHARDNSDDLVYTADTGSDVNLDDFARETAVLVADSAAMPTAPEEMIRQVHMTPQHAADLATRVSARTLVLSHMWEENDPMNAAMSARESFQGRLHVAFAGMTLTW